MIRTPTLPLQLALLVLACAAVVNLWIFARFTVDDAFITWRYGRNLIEAGLWAYNPSPDDVTQAYTNPIFAVASILPAAMGWDMVLSFKILASAILLALALLLWREGAGLLPLLLLAAVPAFAAHAFSGLETLLYGGALALWFLMAERGAWRRALALGLLLALTRPEAWLLLGLHPLAMLTPGPHRARLIRAARHALILALAAGGYAGFHLWVFGQILPNTFFVKSGNGLSVEGLWKIAPYALPILAVLIWGQRRTGLWMALYFGPVVYSYASSDLLMNYLDRFPFQIVLPLYLYAAVALSRPRAWPWGMAALTAYLGAYAWDTRSLGDHLGVANYYPRLLDSHVALGHALQAMGSPPIALGDAGAIPFHARSVTLDTIGLGSATVAHQGLTPSVLAQADPTVIAFFADAEGARDYPRGVEALRAHASAAGMVPVCTLIYAPHYRLFLEARAPDPALLAACEASRVNDTDELRYFLAQIARPPWDYWHE